MKLLEKNMLYLNNDLLTAQRIQDYVKQNKEALKTKGQNERTPSKLQQFKNKLQAIFLGSASSDDLINRLNNQRFTEHYSYLKETLTIIFSSSNVDVIANSLNTLKEAPQGLSDWQALSAESEFTLLNEQYGYFDGNLSNKQKTIAFNVFMRLAISCHMMIVLFEENNTPSDTMAYSYAYKLMAMFLSHETLKIPCNEQSDFISMRTDELFNFISIQTHKLLDKGPKKANKPFHQILIVELQLPNRGTLNDLVGWQAFIQKRGQSAISFFNMANAIEKKIHECKQVRPRAPLCIEEAKEIRMNCKYERIEEDRSFANLCINYDIQNHRFNACLDFMQKGRQWPQKQWDNLPNIEIKSQNNFYWCKLPVGDKHSLFLGDITSSCQSIGNDAEYCVSDAVSLSKNGLYVLLKPRKPGEHPLVINDVINTQYFEIIGQSYVWISATHNLCLDSFEFRKDSISTEAISEILSQFANQVIDENPDIHYVTLGTTGNLPENFCGIAPIPEVMSEGYFYGDAAEQYLIATRDQSVPLSFEKVTLEFQQCVNYLRPYMKEGDQENFDALFHNLLKENPSLKTKLTIESLRIFLMLTSTPSLDDFRTIPFDNFQTMTDETIKDALKSISVGQLFLLASETDQFDYIFERKKVEFVQRIKHLNDFIRIYTHLSSNQRNTIFDAMKGSFSMMITSKTDLIALSELDAEHGAYAIEEAQEKIKQKITSIKELSAIYEKVKKQNKESYRMLCQHLFPFLLSLINTPEDLKDILILHPKAHEFTLSQEAKDKSKQIITSIEEYLFVCRQLNKKLPGIILNEIKDNPKDIFESADFIDIRDVFLLCKSTGLDDVFDIMKPKLKDKICSVTHFIEVCRHIDKDKKGLVFELIQNKVNQIILKSDNFNGLCEHLSTDHCTIVFESVKDKITQLIHSARNFHDICRHLNSEQVTFVFEGMGDEFHKHVNSRSDLFYLCKYLNLQQRMYVFDSMENRILDWVNTVSNFRDVGRCFSEQQHNFIFETKKSEIVSSVKTLNDFTALFACVSHHQKAPIFEIFKNKLKDMMSTPQDCYILFRVLNEKQTQTIYNDIKDKMLPLIKSPNDFTVIYNPINKPERMKLLTKMQGMIKEDPTRYKEALKKEIAAFTLTTQCKFFFERKNQQKCSAVLEENKPPVISPNII